MQELLAARLIAVLATFDPSGSIHAVPMWYAASGQAVILATSSHSRKVDALERDPRATLVLHDSRPGFEVCGASIVGTVEIVRGTDAWPLIELVHRRYVAADGVADSAVHVFLASDDVALRLRPEAGLTWDERDSEATAVMRSRAWGLPLVTTSPRRTIR